jgi:hypothetical protein
MKKDFYVISKGEFKTGTIKNIPDELKTDEDILDHISKTLEEFEISNIELTTKHINSYDLVIDCNS